LDGWEKLARQRDIAAYVVESRRHVHDAFAALPIFRRTREQALYNYCAVLEVESFKAAANQTQLFSAGRAAVESGIQAIPALFERCSPGQTDPQVDEILFSEAYNLFVFSRALEQVQYSFALADKGQFEIYVAKRDPRITFAYAVADSDITDTFRRSGELLERSGFAQPSGADAEAMAKAVADVRASLNEEIRFASPDRITYEYTPDLSARVARWAELLKNAVQWDLSPWVKLGEISLATLRRFWGAVLAISNTHDLAHLNACAGDCHKWAIGSRVNLRPRKEWIGILSAITGLSKDDTATILGWLTFDLGISAKTPMLQPFLEILSDQLCVPSLFLITNNFERNFLRLLNRHPALIGYSGAVNASKEPLALAEMSALFPGPTYRTKQQVVLPKTDADLVVYEGATGWVMILQHKWLIGPDTASESASNDDELNKGIRQGVLARDYWRREPGHLRNALSLPGDAPITNVEACVVCRGADATGFLAVPAIPVITETAFRSLLNPRCGLQTLWTLLNARPDLTEAVGRFRDVTYTVPLAGYEFVLPGLAL
jgi:hypothetical protein